MPASDRPYTSVWARPPRKERSTLSRERIVTEAVRLLDGEGIGALSMRKLAARLGAGATSIYWHVANRDELIELVIDEVYGEVEIPDVEDDGGDWRAATRRIAHSMRGAIAHHPWLVSVLDHLVAGLGGPNALRLTERLLALFEGVGFSLREAERALNTMAAYVIGVAVSEAAWHTATSHHAGNEREWIAETQRVAEEATKDYPRLRELVAHYQDVDVRGVMDEDFDYGLERILDGIGVRLDALSRPMRAARKPRGKSG